MRFVFSLLFICGLTSSVFGQSLNWGIEAKPKAGFLVAHRGVMGHIPHQHAYGGEISFFVNTGGKKQWHHDYNFPKVGVTVYSSTVGNMDLMGVYTGAYGFIDFPFAKSSRAEFSGKLGLGAAYGSKVFDQELNPKNVAMSTHVNALICLGLQYRQYFGKSHVIFGLDLTHCSNGSTEVPNLGINLPYLSLGYGYTFRNAPKTEAEDDGIIPGWSNYIIGIFSTKEVFPTGGRKYPVYAMSFVSKRLFRPKTGVEFSFDFIYKTSINAYRPANVPKTKEGIAQMGIYSGYVLPLKKLHFVLGMGLYFRDEYFPDSRLYHRLGIRYQVNRRLLLNLTLKTHWAKADYVEYGIGYVF